MKARFNVWHAWEVRLLEDTAPAHTHTTTLVLVWRHENGSLIVIYKIMVGSAKPKLDYLNYKFYKLYFRVLMNFLRRSYRQLGICLYAFGMTNSSICTSSSPLICFWRFCSLWKYCYCGITQPRKCITKLIYKYNQT